ncbi:uncharacterized protein LOC112894774 isoform X4 [Panicum hallii]|uniref:uncharacterized protein LOC112894774 isoform X4 n=1 Tax=Panicum hallii TaxID=206008 RepID=UPI000DF4D2DD|nr:uncharacterized protein LOC112894774 isoform X4 [Panicum hallii]
MAIALWCLQTFRDAEGLYHASDSDEQLLIHIPFMQEFSHGSCHIQDQRGNMSTALCFLLSCTASGGGVPQHCCHQEDLLPKT